MQRRKEEIKEMQKTKNQKLKTKKRKIEKSKNRTEPKFWFGSYSIRILFGSI